MITHGIPQGSTLSTTFFLLYINDITSTVTSPVYTYADDTTLVVTAADPQALQTLAQTQLTALVDYFHRNNLVPNPTKTNYSVFSTDKTITLKIQATTLQQNSSAPLLGITLQDNLKHHQTINKIIRKLQPTIHSFRYANKLLPTTTMIELYYSQVYPHLIGNISIWGSTNPQSTYLQPLIRTQKKIIRLIANKPPRTHTAPIMQKYRLHSLTSLYILRVCAEIRPFIHPAQQQPNRPTHHHQYLRTSQLHRYPTRHSSAHQQFIPNPRSHRFSNTKAPLLTMAHLSSSYAQVWNALPEALKEEKFEETFKTKLKEHLLREQRL